MLQLLIEKAHLVLKDYSYCKSKNFYIIIISQWLRVDIEVTCID